MKDKELRTEPKGMNSGGKYGVLSCTLPITGGAEAGFTGGFILETLKIQLPQTYMNFSFLFKKHFFGLFVQSI